MRTALAFAFLGEIRIFLFFCSKGDTLLVPPITPGDDPKLIKLE